ncbi:beta-ketoacyl synthase N-terminal-like domain-containing protein [Paraburkholderia dilworthii]|uniref:beta-ketoacyl synthase N-terminal-like domain-containing protein n=1 Tax=Paraburkholderia dilworthii TaxID=948106 RepID=UPI00041F05F4|nr:beta-ketoacyl synthase N-terminal-like domain-containing protein [Paraburkholderia dilworthii]
MPDTSNCGDRSAPLATIAGVGAVSLLGEGAVNFWRGLFAPPGQPVPAAIRGLSDIDDTPRHAYPATGVPNGYSGDASPSRFDRMVAAAVDESLRDAGWCGEIAATATLGLILGTAAGDTETTERRRHGGHPTHFADDHGYRTIDTVTAASPHSFSGPVMAVSNACSAGLYALTLAAEFIASGMADAMCVVGADVLSRVTQTAFHRMTALDPQRCRPFDAQRQGTLFGEGAVAMLLVSPTLAQRVAQSYCHVRAYGLSCDAYHPTSPGPDSRDVRAAIERALDSAALGADRIRLILPHGTGTPANDLMEGRLLADKFDCASGKLIVLPIKAHIGHTAGASGCFAVLAAAMAMSSAETPAVRHIEVPDPAIPIRFPDTSSTHHRAGMDALINAYAFGGSNTSVILEPAA